MSKIRIDKNDKSRILLTEMLPYEVPMLFSNEGLYSIINRKEYEHFNSIIKQKKQKYGIPFNYQISKNNEGETRTLSVIHPFNQVKFIDFYDKYDSIIIHLCSKSPFSLRKINRVAKFTYSPDLVFEEDEHHSREVETEPDILDVESRIFKSYFIYAPVDLIYKFYERNEYQRLEQRFNYLWEFDISKCFYHIYTHSLTWAVKDKETAKRNATLSTFENRFDKLMQEANYNETNGIVVGPEISRIYAEVLLQQVDLNVLEKLKLKELKFGIDYEIRRYVDDFFVFTNDEKISEVIFRTYQKELESYKLYLNSNKTKKSRTPLITDITVAKRQVKKLCHAFFNDIISFDKETVKIEPIKKPYFLAQSFIKDFQSIVRQNAIHYDAVNKDVVRIFKSVLVKLLRKIQLSDQYENIENFLLMHLDITFYCYSLNINASSTFKVAQIIVLISKFMINKPESLKQVIFSKISKETEFVMTTYHRKLQDKETNIEILNLLIPLKLLGEGYLITERKIREYFDLEVKEESKEEMVKKFCRLNYFQTITLLYYFDNHPQYDRFKKTLEASIVKKFELEDYPFSKADFTCLFFDFICCPFVTIESKRKVVRHSNYSSTDPAIVNAAIDKIMEQKYWFMNWDTEIDLEQVLKKKEWSTAY